MNKLAPTQFIEFFGALYQDRENNPLVPMKWQMELVHAACEGKWHEFIDVPTGAGKTSAIDIAVFALAVQADRPPEKRSAPMRTFLVVDRRTIVSEAYYRAEKMSEKLRSAKDGILKVVADKLRSYSGGNANSEPLAVVQLRGGIYRDPGWFDSLSQPMVIASTVDQVGSRLLFRGYGVSTSSRPIQAAAVAHDSLIILDEAHISPAFSQTLGYIQEYQQSPWCEAPQPLPLKLVQMTATPPEDSDTTKNLRVDDTELNDPTTRIGRLVSTNKRAKLVVGEKIKGAKAPKQLATILVEEALSLAFPDEVEQASGLNTDSPKVIAIMCNMVATAKEVIGLLNKNKKITDDQVELIIGAMRPLDRDSQTDRLREKISTGADRDQITEPIFVVATQCIEVGADYDFDILVTEAAPIKSLVQRFGRLNRAGRDIAGDAVVVMRGDRVKPNEALQKDDGLFKFADPIYANAMSYTWNWIKSIADDGFVDFGILSMKNHIGQIDKDLLPKLSSALSDAPVLMPDHLDLLCQTSDEVWPDPDVSLWLHGPQRNDPDVQVCWRADVIQRKISKDDGEKITTFAPLSKSDFIHTVSLCPPTSAECLSVSMKRVMSWLSSVTKQKNLEADTTGDVPGFGDNPEFDRLTLPPAFRPLAWRGLEHSVVVTQVQDIRPGDTLIFSPLAGGWNELGYLPEFNGWIPRDEKGNQLHLSLAKIESSGSVEFHCNAEDCARMSKIDLGTRAFAQSRQRPIGRFHQNLPLPAKLKPLLEELKKQGKNFGATASEVLEAVCEMPEIAAEFEDLRPKQVQIDYYPLSQGFVLKGPFQKQNDRIPTEEDDGSDLASQVSVGQPVELLEHLENVQLETMELLKCLPLSDSTETLSKAALWHDWGKADPRFQAMLLGGDLYWALSEDRLYAKSASVPNSLREKRRTMERSELPKRFRHEMLSVQLIDAAANGLDGIDRELLLHLVASHHGYARPLAPVCIDTQPPEVSLENIDLPNARLSESDRKAICMHRFDSPVAERFWRVVRKYGWWGTVFLETVLRLADRRVSQRESFAATQQTEKSQTAKAN